MLPLTPQVKQNFDRFISCKTTIDDIYVKLHRIESETAGVSTEVLFNAITEVRLPSQGAGMWEQSRGEVGTKQGRGGNKAGERWGAGGTAARQYVV
jgi:hypothetical protein